MKKNRVINMFFVILLASLNLLYSHMTVETAFDHAFTFHQDAGYLFSPYLKGTYKTDSLGSLKGEVSVVYADETLLLDQAFIKARTEKLSLTFGKTHLKWGEGVFFNSANILFPSDDILSSALSVSRYLTSVEIPLGDFSFVETTVVTKQTEAHIGLRGYTSLPSMKLEGGVVISDENIHPYLSIGKNWYVNISSPFWYDSNQHSLLKETYLSGGIRHIHFLLYGGTLSFVAEGELNLIANPLRVYSELSWATENRLVVALKAIGEVAPSPDVILEIASQYKILDKLTLSAGLSLKDVKDPELSLRVGLSALY